MKERGHAGLPMYVMKVITCGGKPVMLALFGKRLMLGSYNHYQRRLVQMTSLLGTTGSTYGN